MDTKFSPYNLEHSPALMGQWAEANLADVFRYQLNLNISIDWNVFSQLFYEWGFYKT
jgi:hypothetical protein